MKLTLFKKLVATYLVILFATLAILGTFLSQFLHNYLLRAKEEDLVSQGTQLSKLASGYMDGRISEENFNSIISSLDSFLNARVWIVDSTGLVRIASGNGGEDCRNGGPGHGFRLNRSEMVDILQGNIVKKNGKTPYFEEQVITVAVPLYSSASLGKMSVEGAVFLNAPVSEISTVLGKIHYYLGMAIMLSITISLGLIFFLSKTITAPLTGMKRAAVSMAAGDYSVRVPPGTGEIGDLSEAFNHLSTELEGQIDDLIQEKSKVESVVLSTTDGIVAVDKECSITMINPAALSFMGVRVQAQQNGEKSTVSKLADIDSGISELFRRVLKSRDKNFETSIIKINKKIIKVAVASIMGAKDEVGGAVGILHDITQLERLENLRRTYIVNLSHEIRTPLAIIRGYNDALEEGIYNGDTGKKECHAIIRDETGRLERLVKEILDLHSMESENYSLQLEPVDLIEIIENAVKIFKAKAAKKGLQINYAFPESGLVTVMGNEDRLMQLMIIFIDNAINYTGDGGQVKIKITEEAEIVRVSVKDNGEGIPDEDIPLIWERFYKADSSRQRRGQGTGLGLAIARQIIELLSGNVWVDSKFGEGAAFTFILKKHLPAE